MFSWIQLRLIAPAALVTLALLGALAALGEPTRPLLLALPLGSLFALVLWVQGIRSHDVAVRELRAAAERVSGGGRVEAFEVQHRPDELGALARTLRRASEELERRAIAREVERDELRTIIRSIQDGLVAVDGELKVLLWSPQATELLGLADAPREGTPLVDAGPHGELVALARRALKTGATERAEAPLYGGPEGERRLEVSAAPITRDDHVFGVVLVLHDVTEVHLHQRARREFAGNVSHELRTPLQLVKGFVETLKDGALTDPEKGPRFLDIVHRHVLGLERLVNDLLTLLTLEGRIETREPVPVDVGEGVELIVAGFEEHAAKKGLTIATDLAPNLPRVLARPDLFDRAVQNLIDNAIKYTGPGGRIAVEARARPKRRVAIAVRDTGPGIPPEDLPHVFTRFYRVDKSRSREQGGTGLGLAIVKHIMQLEGGEVRVESSAGEGTTFTLLFPQVKGSARAEGPPAGGGPDKAGGGPDKAGGGPDKAGGAGGAA